MKYLKVISLVFVFVCSSYSFACEYSSKEINSEDKAKAATQRSLQALIEGKKGLADLISCFESSSPLIRDTFAFATLSDYLRGEAAHADKVLDGYSSYIQAINNALNNKNTKEWAHSFLILALSEFARYDRINSILNTEQRQSLVELTNNSILSIDNYSGFTEDYGWIHNVAHHSDLVLQLALNKAINQQQLETLALALEAQISPQSAHAYIHNESDRLARSLVYLFNREEISDDFIRARIESLATPPAPLSAWNDAYNSNEGLAHLHNHRFFLARLALWSDGKQNERLKLINELAIGVVKKI